MANAFEPSSRAAAARGPKQRTPAAAQRVGEAGDQRRLGPDDDEVDAGRAGRAGERRRIVGGRVERPRLAPDAGVAGRAQHLRALRRAQQRAHDRVLAPAGADDEDPQRPDAQIAPMKSSIGIAASDS